LVGVDGGVRRRIFQQRPEIEVAEQRLDLRRFQHRGGDQELRR
jgi:hypothetical protein